MNYNKFERISIEEGLSQSVVYCIIQDKEGFIWFGTQDGLNRFDGYNFVHFKNNVDMRSIQNNYINVLLEDRDETIWIGTLNGGLTKYNRVHNYFQNFLLTTSEISKNIECINCLIEDGDDYLWVGSEESGLNKFDKRNNKFIYIDWEKEINCYMDKRITCLTRDSDGQLWIGTWNKGIYILDPVSCEIKNFQNNPGDNSSLSNNLIYSIYEDSMKNILIGTRNGLNIFHKPTNSFEHYHHIIGDENSISGNIVSSICEDKNKDLWIGTRGNGLNNFDIKKKQFKNLRFEFTDKESLSNDTIISQYVDRCNVLWIGTFGGGVCKMDCERKKFFSLNQVELKSNLVSFDVIHSILIDHLKFLWLGTLNNGLYKLSFENKSIVNYNKLSTLKGTSILCIFEDSNSVLWIGTFSGGLHRYNPIENDFTFYYYNDDSSYNVYYVCNDINPDYLWIATHNYGLLKFDLSKGIYVKISKNTQNNKLLSNYVTKCLYLDLDNNLWIGTIGNGLLKYELEKDILRNYEFDITDPMSISDNTIYSICEGKKNSIWIGTHRGLNKFDKSQNCFKRYTIDNGLPDNIIKSMLEDSSGNLWISTNNGISKFNPETETFRNYDSGDGLQSKEFNDGAYFKLKDGTMYFGGINGLNYFKPEEIKDNPYIPNIAITDFQIFNKSVDNSPENPFLKKNITETSEIILSYKESVFSFEFAALIFNNSKKNQYAYRMWGFDKDWIYCNTRRLVTYTNLDPNEYIFQVKGSNNDGVWNEEGASIKITITPPYWKTVWFKSFGFISTASIIGLAYNKRLQKLKTEKLIQEEFSKKLISLQEDERKRIAGELHDSLGQELMIIKNKALIGIKNAENPKVKSQLNEISDLTSATIEEVRKISFNLRPYELDRLGLLKTLIAIVDRMNNSTPIFTMGHIDNIDNIFTPEIEINIYRMIQECFTNILKYSDASNASLQVKKSGKVLIILISDDGKGFNISKVYSDSEKGYGLKGITERARLFGGDFKIESTPGKGTKIEIKLPIKK